LASPLKRSRNFFQGWRAWRRFRSLDKSWRNIVIYSESGQDWHHFSGLVEALTGALDCRICYVSSDPADGGLRFEHPNFIALYMPDGLFLTTFFQFKRCDLCILTVMDLDNLNLRRSVNAVHYLYLFHSMGSTHMVDHANSYDAYDTLFCAGPHQVREIRRREELHGLPAKRLFDYGHPRLETVIAGRTQRAPGHESGQASTILIAPTWGETSIFNFCGERLIEVLLQAGYRVIMRPHYQSLRRSADVIRALKAQFEGRDGFEYIDRMSETDSVLRSDLLISDWSAMALEYALGLEKPVLFIDVPRRIRNPDWQELGIEPMESSIRGKVGTVLAPDNLEQAPEMISQLLQDPCAFSEAMQGLREEVVFRLGHSVPDGAREIARLAQELAEGQLEADEA